MSPEPPAGTSADEVSRTHPEREVMASMLTANAELAAGVLRAGTGADEHDVLRAVAATRSLGVLVEDTLRTLVGQARAAGATWADIGAQFGVSRQAAFQRFGDPARDAAPSAAERTRPVRGARGIAGAALEAFLARRFDTMREGFDPRMRVACSTELLRSVRDGAGELVEQGPPRVDVRKGYTVVDRPLRFAVSGWRTGRIVLDGERRIAGFFILGPDSP